jgi:hypothetical protein
LRFTFFTIILFEYDYVENSFTGGGRPEMSFVHHFKHVDLGRTTYFQRKLGSFITWNNQLSWHDTESRKCFKVNSVNYPVLDVPWVSYKFKMWCRIHGCGTPYESHKISIGKNNMCISTAQDLEHNTRCDFKNRPTAG